MLTHDQLAFAVSKRYPGLIHGRDFMAGHSVDPDSNQQTQEAEILEWRSKDIPQPSIEALREIFSQYADEWHAQETERERKARLAASDWTQLADTPEAIRKPWAEYRQALRDLTRKSGFPLSVDWPVPPAG